MLLKDLEITSDLSESKLGDSEIEVSADGKTVTRRTLDIMVEVWESEKLVAQVKQLSIKLKQLLPMFDAINKQTDGD